MAIQNYLAFSQVDAAELLDARFVIEVLAMRRAAEVIDSSTARALRSQAESETADPQQGELLAELLRVAGNQVARVFGLALAQRTGSLAEERGSLPAGDSEDSRALRHCRRAQIEAVIAGDIARIHQLQAEYLAIWRRLLAQPATPSSRAGARSSQGRKRSEQVSDQLLARIAGLGFASDHNLGSEAELMAEYAVSRAMLREAIRPLERHGIVAMRRGRGARSGLRVARPNPGATVRSAVLYLKYIRVPVADVYAMQQVLEHAAAASAAGLERGREALGNRLIAVAGASRPRDAIAVEQYMGNFYLELGNGCGNRVYGLFMRILVNMVGLEMDAEPLPTVPDHLIDANCAACLDLARAIRDGDQAMARRNILEWRKVALAMSPRERPAEQIVARELLRDT
jgi:DNA-binding FadR family transcriptional regulator